MHIVSLTGPGCASGLSAALTAACLKSGTAQESHWWHLKDGSVQVRGAGSSPTASQTTLAAYVVDGHYRYCNSFLWPVLHDVPQYATYREDDHQAYIKLNRVLGWYVAEASAMGQRGDAFVHDFQLALVPQRLRETTSMRSSLFWHVPWPKHVFEPHRAALREIAQALLSAEIVGFQCDEYAQNFLKFVDKELAQFTSDLDDYSVWTSEHVTSTRYLTREAATRFRGISFNTSCRKVTRVVVKPLPIESERWDTLARTSEFASLPTPLNAVPFIVSVDRADYTTGLSERLEAIDLFFERHEERRGKVVFAQVCEQTRTGIGAFDGYYKSCEQSGKRIQEKWSTGDWQPLHWIEAPLSNSELSILYANATAMLVNNLRDGLNLPAKEYVYSQVKQPGILMLSPTVGAWDELKSGALPVTSGDPVQTADQISSALSMDARNRLSRLELMRAAIDASKPEAWWQFFSQVQRTADDTAVA